MTSEISTSPNVKLLAIGYLASRCFKHLLSDIDMSIDLKLVLYSGRMKDEGSLRDHKVTKGSKIMLVGSTVSDVMSVSAPDPKVLKEEEKAAASASKEPLCKQKVCISFSDQLYLKYVVSGAGSAYGNVKC